MEITEAIIPAPRFLNSKSLARALAEAEIPTAALGLLAADFRLPEQLLLDGRIVASIVVRRKDDPLPQRKPRRTIAAARQAPRASYPQLDVLERRARREPSLQRHRRFWHSLEDAKAGRHLSLRQRQLLEAGWKKLERMRRRQLLYFTVHGRRMTSTVSFFAYWLARMRGENQGAAPVIPVTAATPAVGAPSRRSQDVMLADMAPQRQDIEQRRRPHFTDTDSGDEG